MGLRRANPLEGNLLTLVHLLQKRPSLLVKSVTVQRCLLLLLLLSCVQGYDECCNESTTHTGNFVVENKNIDQKSPPIAEQVLKEHHYAVDINEVSSVARCKPFEVCQRCVKHHKRISDLELELQKAWELIKTLQTEIDSLQHKYFSINDIKHDDHLVELYTGIPTYGVFKFLSEKLEGKVTNMTIKRMLENKII